MKTDASLLDRIRWPHVAIIVALIAGVVAVLVLAPDTTVGHILRIVASVMGLGGIAGTGSSTGVLRSPEEIPPPASLGPRPIPRRRKNDGSTEQAVLVAITIASLAYAAWIRLSHILGMGVLLLVLLPGCAAGTTLATVVASAKPVAEAGCFAVRRAAELCDRALGPEVGAPTCTAGDESP